jgi:hypothetical protein
VQQAASLTDLSGKPLIVLTADTGHDDEWQSKQDHLATPSTNSLHRIAKATTHESLIDDEADSAAASQAIHDVVASVRSSQPLPARWSGVNDVTVRTPSGRWERTVGKCVGVKLCSRIAEVPGARRGVCLLGA